MFSNWRRAKNFPAFKAEVQKPCGNLTALSETGRRTTTRTPPPPHGKATQEKTARSAASGWWDFRVGK